MFAVCIYLFRASGNRHPTLNFTIHQNFQEVSSVDCNIYDYTQDFSAEVQKNQIEIEDSGFIKIPHNNFRVK
ncbi:MAG: hypothetical protein L3J11_06600 [Draconibacterium sp.]|nr:hypothetical protein [Draconibacterium sp.]